MANTSVILEGGMFDSTEVTETVDGFPVGNKAVGSDFFAKMISTLYKNGVAVNGDPNAFRIVAGSGMNLSCQPGCAWINGYMTWNREVRTIPISAGRRCVVCLRLNVMVGNITLFCAENPASGSVPMRQNGVYDLVLAEVDVPSGALSAADAVITDCRYDTALCGAVTSAAEGLNTIAFAENAGQVGGHTADEFVRRSGGVMTGKLRAAAETTGGSAVRNIRYGTEIPADLEDGEIFILIQQ